MSDASERRPGDSAAVGGPPAPGGPPTGAREPAQGAPDGSSVAVDPAPYAWLDDDARMAGAISPGMTAGYGVFFLATTLALVIVSFATHHLGGLWIAVGFGLIGGLVLRMGLARRAWRLRHPGIDPLSTVPSPTGGSAYGPDTRSGAVGRWVLLVLSLLLGLLFVAALVHSFASGSSATPATQIVLAVLSALVLAVAWYDLRRILRLRAQHRSGPRQT